MATVNLWEYDSIWLGPGQSWHIWFYLPQTLQTVLPVFQPYPWGRGFGEGSGGQTFRITDQWLVKTLDGGVEHHLVVENTGELSGSFIPMLSWILNPI
jgi:hypothetical protein